MNKTKYTAPILPVLHMNGTSKKMLLEGYENVETQILALIDEMQKVEFNARDYYVNDSWQKARAEREEILLEIKQIQSYFQNLIIGIYEGGAKNI
jgi:hypothetical protein